MATVWLRRGWGVATTAWAVLLAAANTGSEGPKCPSSRVLQGLGAFEVSGSGRVPLICIHGWACDGQKLVEVSRRLAKDFRIFRVRRFPDTASVSFLTRPKRRKVARFSKCESMLFFGKQYADLPCLVRDQDFDREP